VHRRHRQANSSAFKSLLVVVCGLALFLVFLAVVVVVERLVLG
jgi:hypothetical protein